MARKFHAKQRRKGNQEDVRRRKRGKRRFAEDASNSSDEDYVLDDEEEDDDEDEGLSSEVNESDEEEEAQSTSSEDSEELSDAPKSRKPRRNRIKSNGRAHTLKEKPRNRATKRVKISSSDDEDFEPDLSSTTDDDEYDDDSEEEEIAVLRKSRQKTKRVTKSKRSDARKPKKKKKTTSVSKRSVRKKNKRNPALQNFASNKRRKTAAVSHNSIRNTDRDDSVSNAYFVKPPKRARSQRKSSRNEETERSTDSVSDEHLVIPPKRARSQRKSSRNEETGWRSTHRRKIILEPDFTCSESDADYTISEEDSGPSYRSYGYTKTSSRSMRSLSIEKEEIISSGKDQQKRYTSFLEGKIKKEEERLRRKGKQKVEESENAVDSELSKPVCGICLSEDGKPSRGKLDCCDHYFCFACIMEWAKVESRCPMCKQRFRTISKSSKSGKGLRGTTIKIPVRNQVYQPSEEEVMGFLDPYANIVCLECNEAGDDDLLLLCDCCDSAYHTYCVGLGRAIPEGDWYCQGCQTSMPGQLSIHEEEVEDFVLDLDNGDDLVEDAPVGMVAERINFDLNLSPPSSSPAPLNADTRPSHLRTIRRRILRRSTPNPSPRLPDAARVSVRQAQVFGSTSQVSSVRARTLSGQRMLQERVQALHDNWTAPERGFQQFSPGSSVAGHRFGVSDGADAIVQPTPNHRSLLFRESVQRSNLAPVIETENAAVKSDVDQAWAMMEHARALGDDDRDLANAQRDGRHWQGSSSGHKRNDFSELMCKSRSRVVAGSILTAPVRSRTSNSQDRRSPATVNCLGNPKRITEEISCREIGNNILPTPSVSNGILGLRLSERSNSPHNELNNATSLGRKPHENGGRKVEGAKDKVISMVKSHMKRTLTREHIEKDQFKEIARCCTHTILAACGIEHSRSRVQPFEVVSCCHTDEVQYSELMPGCCTDCFNSFVKELVGKIVDRKVGTNA